MPNFRIIQFNKLRRNVVVSRRAVLENQVASLRQEIIHKLFPGNIVAGMFGFGKSEFFEIEVPAEREVPKVSFS